MLIPTLLLGGYLYYLILAVMAEKLLLPDVIARELPEIVARVNFAIFVSLPVIFVLLLIWAAYLSRKMIAPLNRLEEDLRKIDQGDYSVRLEIEKDHDLREVADVVNRLTDKIQHSERNETHGDTSYGHS